MISVYCYLAVSTLLFFIGVFGFVTHRNLVAMLISIELVLNSVDLNFAVFIAFCTLDNLKASFSHCSLWV